MMEINTTDQDEIEILKKWWKENGTSLVTGLVVGLTILFGWRGWNEYVDSQGMAASQYFEQMQNAIIQQQAEKAEGVGNQLIDQYPGTVYATNAALALAALSVERNDGAAARVHFQWVIEKSSFDSSRQLAQLGVARTYLNDGNLEQALNNLEGSDGIYRSHFSEVKGDVLRQKGDHAAARAAYADALQLTDVVDPRRELLEMKIDEVKS
ncbi:MAG: tetratricopeptide repeat protein [Gammaproteobacteria bacterium]|jgi:predicted negative regulator of RcsB-dependent stress response|nr:tetratricopeptide repeat protein [Gammaproteobacteria bacterium]MBT3488876.1 tetratricopeptide repeat protein [Gammaproteobacteria bacterium]MBT3719314.1 tetratricopeptide repeat protein [Gammaproteobacteria bacterium]MBT3844492.1 tetratricopeptide repeat protein [Gammaproteobacteria bacterium]MBT3891946.1 tetratricopeptide repeat protein [Gammaproteobacteria bacterium]